AIHGLFSFARVGAAVEEGVGLGQRDDEVLDPPTRAGELLREVVDGAGVILRFGAAVGVAEPLHGHAALDLGRVDEQAGQLGHAVELALGGRADDLAGGVDRLAGLAGAPAPDAVEVLEAEPDRVHERVAAGALRIDRVLLEALAGRQAG